MADYKYLGFLLEYKEYFNVEDHSTYEEVDKLEAKLGIKFPACYRELYVMMGMSRAFRIGPENSFLFPNYDGMNATARSIAKSTGVNVDIGGNDFVFCCFNETGFFWFFKLDEGDDPPVYQYEEYDEDYIKAGNSLSGFIREMEWYRAFLNFKRDYPR